MAAPSPQMAMLVNHAIGAAGFTGTHAVDWDQGNARLTVELHGAAVATAAAIETYLRQVVPATVCVSVVMKAANPLPPQTVFNWNIAPAVMPANSSGWFIYPPNLPDPPKPSDYDEGREDSEPPTDPAPKNTDERLADMRSDGSSCYRCSEWFLYAAPNRSRGRFECSQCTKFQFRPGVAKRED